MSRKLVTIQRIESIEPIDGADLIVKARVLGWNVVVKKDLHEVGELVAYFEVDSFLPEADERFSEFQSRGQKTITHEGKDIVGHVLKTIKLRGIVSQGLIMPLKPFMKEINSLGNDETWEPPIGLDITSALNVLKYEEPLPNSGEIIGPFDQRWSPKSDAIRIQTLAEKWEEIKKLDWVATVKVDGTSQTLVNDGEKTRIFSRNWELTPEAPGMTIARKFGLVDAIERHPGMAIQFEFAGPGIQKNRLKLSEQQPFVFAVWMKGQKVDRNDWPVEALKAAAPVLNSEWNPAGTLEEMIEKVAGLRGNVTKDTRDEGIVYHIVGDAPDWLERNANFKIISNGYLLKHKI